MNCLNEHRRERTHLCGHRTGPPCRRQNCDESRGLLCEVLFLDAFFNFHIIIFLVLFYFLVFVAVVPFGGRGVLPSSTPLYCADPSQSFIYICFVFGLNYSELCVGGTRTWVPPSKDHCRVCRAFSTLPTPSDRTISIASPSKWGGTPLEDRECLSSPRHSIIVRRDELVAINQEGTLVPHNKAMTATPEAWLKIDNFESEWVIVILTCTFSLCRLDGWQLRRIPR